MQKWFAALPVSPYSRMTAEDYLVLGARMARPLACAILYVKLRRMDFALRAQCGPGRPRSQRNEARAGLNSNNAKETGSIIRPSRSGLLREAQHIFLPLQFEGPHISCAQNLLQTLVARRILLLMRVKLTVKLYQQSTLL